MYAFIHLYEFMSLFRDETKFPENKPENLER